MYNYVLLFIICACTALRGNSLVQNFHQIQKRYVVSWDCRAGERGKGMRKDECEADGIDVLALEGKSTATIRRENLVENKIYTSLSNPFSEDL